MNACSRRWLPLLLLAVLFAASGASCPRMIGQIARPLPRALPVAPTLEQVIEVANRNSAQIQSFSTNRATIRGQGFPALTASVAFQRPRRFRLRAEYAMTGAEFDVGSNDELFWFWLRRNDPPGVYFCRHDQFAACQARQVVPLEPAWLVEALGVAEFDPALPHQMTLLPNDRVRIDTIRNTPEGPTTKISILDGAQGWILEQYQFDVRRQLVASATASAHRRDPLTGLFLPTVVEVHAPPAKLALRIDLGNVEINRLGDNRSELWTMPNYPGTPMVDLCNPNVRPPVPAPEAVSRR